MALGNSVYVATGCQGQGKDYPCNTTRTVDVFVTALCCLAKCDAKQNVMPFLHNYAKDIATLLPGWIPGYKCDVGLSLLCSKIYLLCFLEFP